MDRHWAAVYEIFDLRVLVSKRPFLYSCMNEERQEIDWPALKETARPWSHGEQVLVRIAHALYNGGDRVTIDELAVLSSDVRRAVLNIIDRFYG